MSLPPCLLLTRPRVEAHRFAAQARALGWRGAVLISPVLEIELRPPDTQLLERAGTLVFTSQHAVAALIAATTRRDWPVWAVGPRTAEAARAAGFPDVRQSGGDATALLQDLGRTPVRAPVLHLRGEHVAADIVSHLRKNGQEADALLVYMQAPRPLSAEARDRLQQGGTFVLPIFSPRSGQVLAAELAVLALEHAHLHLLAISEAVTTAMQGVVFRDTRVAERPDAQAMLTSLGALQAKLEPW